MRSEKKPVLLSHRRANTSTSHPSLAICTDKRGRPRFDCLGEEENTPRSNGQHQQKHEFEGDHHGDLQIMTVHKQRIERE